MKQKKAKKDIRVYPQTPNQSFRRFIQLRCAGIGRRSGKRRNRGYGFPWSGFKQRTDPTSALERHRRCRLPRGSGGEGRLDSGGGGCCQTRSPRIQPPVAVPLEKKTNGAITLSGKRFKKYSVIQQIASGISQTVNDRCNFKFKKKSIYFVFISRI